jgi:signal transduction histidine kinase
MNGDSQYLFDHIIQSFGPIDDVSFLLLDASGFILTSSNNKNLIGLHFSYFYLSEEITDGKPEFELKIAAGPEGRFKANGRKLRRDGKSFWTNILITSLKTESEHLMGYSVVIQDITKNKKIKELEESLRMREEFISVASHEFRTPLTKILMNLQFIRKKSPELHERIIKSLDICEDSSRELVKLMDGLVDVSRLRLGKIELKRTKTNITDIILNMLDKFKDQIRLAGNHVSFSYDKKIVGYWDQARLEQLFSNLLSNALKYAPEKFIKMELKQQNGDVLFIISDDGPGIPYPLQSKVFQRFERAVDSKKISGLGLGLYVSRQIVLAHMGTITLESHPGHGTTFLISLPLKSAMKIIEISNGEMAPSKI